MTEEDKKLLHTFEGKLRQLLFLYEELKKENLSLRNEIDRKSAEITQLECNNKELEAKYINLKNARILSINDNDKNGFMTVVNKLDRTKGLDLILHMHHLI